MATFTYLFVCSFFFSLSRTSISQDALTVSPTQSIRDGGTLVSPGRSFQLGFFSPGNSKSRYVGIWYTISSETVVWVANRDNPLNDHLGVLKLTDDGILLVLNSTNRIVWSSNTSRTPENPVAQLLDTGNLVVKDRNDDDPDNYLWQSFDFPCDTLLPKMKLGWNLVTGRETFLSSWKSTEDPAQGAFSFRIDPRGYPQLVAVEGAKIKAISGSWNGIRFSGIPSLRPNLVYGYGFVLNEKEIYYEYNYKLLNTSSFSRIVENPSGVMQQFTWMDRTHSWELFYTSQGYRCENYAVCGAYATCNINNSPLCACLEGFLPKSAKYWDSVDWSDGCVRRTPLECNDDGDGFLKRAGLKLPDTSSSSYNNSMSLKDCEGLCLKNCSCTAYASLDVRGGGSGCLLWFDSLVDIREFAEGGQGLYIRMAATELDRLEKKRHSRKKKLVAIIVGSVFLVVGMTIVVLVSYIWKKKLINQATTIRCQRKDYENEGGKEDIELRIFDLAAIAKATDNFSNNKKLGEGGFGPVYKAWKLWIENRPTELIDELVGDLCTLSNVLRHIHVGLLCVQQRPEDRPNMSSVVHMLSSESLLPKPRQPGFFTDSPQANPSSTKHATCSANEITNTILEGR